VGRTHHCELLNDGFYPSTTESHPHLNPPLEGEETETPYREERARAVQSFDRLRMNGVEGVRVGNDRLKELVLDTLDIENY